MGKRWSKVVSFILVVAFAVSVVCTPINTAFARSYAVNQQEDTAVQSDTSQDGTSSEDAKLDKQTADAEDLSKERSAELAEMKSTELVEQRDECTKYYQLEDGTNEAVLYGCPIHYLEDREYKDIDNSLSLTTNKDGKQVYVNADNDFKVEISQNSDKASVSYNGYKLSWTIDDISKGVKATKEDRLTKDEWNKMSEGDKRHNSAKLSDGVIYQDVMQDVDLQYAAISKQIKENVVFNKKTDVTTISEQVTTTGLVLIKNDDGSIDAVDSKTKEPVFLIQPTYLIDDNGDTCDNIGVELTTSKDGYTITYTLDKEWMEKAAYPVIFDPTATVNTGTDGSYVTDNRICQGLPTTNYKSEYIMCTGNGSTSQQNRSLIKFNNLPSISPSKIYAAKLKAIMIYDNVAATSTVAVHKVTSNWTSNVTWNTRPSYNSAYSSVSVTPTQGATYTWNIKQIAIDWYTDNDGLQLKDTASSSNYKEFATWQSYWYDGPKAYFYYDTTVPAAPTSVTTTPVATSTWTNDKTVTLKWSGITDSGGSGLKKAQYQIDDGAWTSIPTSYGIASGSYPITIPSSSKTHTIKVRGVDNVNNYGSTRSVAYKLDVTAPVAPTSVTTSPTASSTWTNDTTVSLSWSGITDAHSGVSYAQYKIDSGSWVNISTSYGITSGTVPITISSSGTHTIYVRGVDKVGYSGATKSVVYKLDVNKPTSPTDASLTPVDWDSGAVTIAASGATDAISGVQKYQYSTTSLTEGFADIPANNQITLTSGDTTVYVRAVDNAGNAGIAVPTNVMPEPVTDLSVKSNVNYTVALSWTASVTPNVTYDIYRNESGQTPELIATDIDTAYWNDYNMNYDTTYLYSVVAKKEYLGATVESVSTAGPQATVVSSDEVNKKVGKKDYEMFAEFSTQSGNGFINPASGNLMYETSDISVESPIGALEFVRSYNSLTNYSTPLGQGWDFNYNIILLKEFDENQNEEGIILKLGNGNMYRFPYDSQTKTYSRPDGLYAELECNGETGKYVLTFKDKTEYMFNLSNQIERITDRNGNWIQFSYNDVGGLVSAEDNKGNDITLTYSTEAGEGGLIKTVTGSGRTYTYTYSNGKLAQAYVTYESQQIGEVYTYTNGMLTTITNPNGFDYDIAYASNKVSTVTNPLSQVMTLTYPGDDDDLLVITEFNNVTQRYYYDSTTLVLKKTQFESENPTLYTYDSDYNLTHITYPDSTEESFIYGSDGNMLTYVNKAGKTATYTYGDTNNPDLPTQIEEPFNGANTKVTVNQYDSAGNMINTYVDGINQSTAYTYNEYGKVLTQIVFVMDGLNTYESETDYTYDSMGRLATTTVITDDPNDGDVVTSQTYDSYGNVDTETDAKGVVTKNYYNILGQQTQQTSAYGTAEAVSTYYECDALGNIVSETDAEGNETTNTYDDIGRQTRADYADDTYSTTSYVVNADGTQVTTQLDAEGKKSITVTDKKGQTILQGTAGDVTDSNNDTTTGNEYTYNGDVLIEYTRSAYDVMGNVTWTKDNTGVETTNTYNNMGWVTASATANGGLCTITTNTYDDMGNVLTAVSPEVNTETTYDKLGRSLIVTNTKNGSSTTTTYAYNGVYSGKLRSVMTDPLNRDKVTEFDEKGNLVKEIFGDKTTEYTYDDNGNMLSSTLTNSNFSGQSAVTLYEYDGNNRKTRVTYSDNDQYVLYTYDDNGNVTMERLYENDTLSCTTENTYDDMNNITETKRNGVTIAQYSYTDNGEVASIKYGSGSSDKKIGYVYDEAGKIIEVKDLTNGGDTPIREYFYLDGQLDYLVDARDTDDARQDFTYDSLGRLTNVKYYDTDDTTVLEEYSITYDDTLTYAKYKIATETTTTNYGGTEIVTEKEYTYDDLGRLTQDSVTETIDQGTPTTTVTAYAYDAVGNRTSMTSGGNTLYYHYNDYDQLLSTDTDNDLQTESDIVTSYGYDLSGNQTSMTEGTTVTTYDYDDANWLQDVTEQTGQDPSVTLAEYEYDAAGQRTQKIAGSDETNYYYNGLDLLYTKDDNGDIIEENVLEDDGSIINSSRADTNDYWYRQDIRGSVTNIVDADDDVVKSYIYDAYGNTDSTGTFINSFAYTGAVIDTETGLYYMNARYYDPATGRLISEDSFRGDGEAFWHLYAYCDGDPVNNTDPTGHFPADVAIDFGIKAGQAIWAGILALGTLIGFGVAQDVSKSISTSTTKAKTKAKTYKRRNFYEVHHIVAQRAKLAKPARDILKDLRIGVQNRINKVSLKYQLHRNLHNTAYYTSVNAAVTRAYKLSRGKRQKNKAVRKTLRNIGNALRIANRLC